MFVAKSPPIPLSRLAFLRTVDCPCLWTVSRVRTSCSVVSLGISGVRDRKFGTFLRAVWQDGRLLGLDESPLSVELEAIGCESRFDRVITEAQQMEESVIVVWMASWCRKCIYLKPKLEKLAADYYPRLRFYCVDVNKAPHRLVARAGVTKMPTIQLWKDSNKQAEVIGRHKAYLVVNEVREMIENEHTA